MHEYPRVGFSKLQSGATNEDFSMKCWEGIICLALCAALVSGNTMAAAPQLCDLQLTIELTPDVPDSSDTGFLSSLLGNHPGYRLIVQRKRPGSVIDVELFGPGPDSLCRNVIDTIRMDGRVQSVHTRQTPA
jgi:hypothetical protein